VNQARKLMAERSAIAERLPHLNGGKRLNAKALRTSFESEKRATI
jgi:hypothetical protein